MQSCFNQDVKSKYYSSNIQKYISNIQINTYSILNNYLNTFSRKNVIVRPYEKNQLINGDICSAFLTIINISDEISFTAM